MDLFIDRFSYAQTETEGVLNIGDFDLATIERPWIAYHYPGGKPFESCVPDGEYLLEPWVRGSNGHEVYILSNPGLGVYQLKDDRVHGHGRYLCLIHIANYVSNVVGCIGPGLLRAIMKNRKTGNYERSVSSSGGAMQIITEQLGREATHRLTIRSKCGASS